MAFGFLDRLCGNADQVFVAGSGEPVPEQHHAFGMKILAHDRDGIVIMAALAVRQLGNAVIAVSRAIAEISQRVFVAASAFQHAGMAEQHPGLAKQIQADVRHRQVFFEHRAVPCPFRCPLRKHQRIIAKAQDRIDMPVGRDCTVNRGGFGLACHYM